MGGVPSTAIPVSSQQPEPSTALLVAIGLLRLAANRKTDRIL
jgi:hypothetical protein